MSDDPKPPPPDPPVPPGPAKPTRRKRAPAVAPSPTGGQTFQLLKFPERPSEIVKPQPQVVACLEEWLRIAREGRLIAIGLCAVTDDGAMTQRCLHSGATIGLLLSSNRLLETVLVQQLLTTYRAPPGSVLPQINPAHEPPPGDTSDVPESDGDE